MASGRPASVRELQAEVVIIGGGGAGLCAAIAALELGCTQVTVLEKAGSSGGSTAMAHDVFGVESPVQKRAWFDTSRDELFNAHMDWTHWTVDPRIVRAFIDKAGDTIGWLEAMGVGFRLMPMYPNQSPLIRHAIEGRGVASVQGAAQAGGGTGSDLLTRTRAKQILRSEDGRRERGGGRDQRGGNDDRLQGRGRHHRWLREQPSF